MSFSLDVDYARRLDAGDPLAEFRARFLVSDPDLIYLDGNSLGRLPGATQELAADLVNRQWGENLIRSWNDGWLEAPERIGAKIAGLIGAHADEVIVADSTSVNLFKLVISALRARPERTRILSDDLNFPSDLYVLQGVIDLLDKGHQLELVSSPDGIHGPISALVERLGEDVALLTLTHTLFKSGYLYDMRALSEAAHAAGALVLWDLSHSVGSVPVDLEGSGADLAVGCTYKYLNGGPGAPAFLYVRRELQEDLGNPLAGWMGQQSMFDFQLDYEPAPGMRGFLTGTSPMLSMAMIEPGVEMLLEAGMERVREKSVRQTDYLVDLWEARLAPLGFTLKSPRSSALRGSHISLGHPDGLSIDLALIHEMKVLPDFRYPDNIRLGIAPLYTSYVDIHSAVERMRTVVLDGIYKKYITDAPAVT